jgi:hypothetical protein
MQTIEHGRTPSEELEGLNSWREANGLPTFVGFRRAGGGVSIGWERDAEPLYEIAGGADGIFYRDQRGTIFVDEAAITLATTQKALWVPARTILPATYFNRPGKTVKISAFGKATTDGTAGNYVFEMAYGAGDAPSAAGYRARPMAGTTSQTNIYVDALMASLELPLLRRYRAHVAGMWGQWSA